MTGNGLLCQRAMGNIEAVENIFIRRPSRDHSRIEPGTDERPDGRAIAPVPFVRLEI